MLDWEKYENKFDYVNQNDQWKTDEARINQEFHDDAIEAAGLTGHPKAEKAYSLAWQNGHSSGFSEVFYHLKDIADMLKD